MSQETPVDTAYSYYTPVAFISPKAILKPIWGEGNNMEQVIVLEPFRREDETYYGLLGFIVSREELSQDKAYEICLKMCQWREPQARSALEMLSQEDITQEEFDMLVQDAEDLQQKSRLEEVVLFLRAQRDLE